MSKFPATTFAPMDADIKAATAVFFLGEGQEFPASLLRLGSEAEGFLRKAIEVNAFKRKRKAILDLVAPPSVPLDRIVIVGLGEAATLAAKDWLDFGGAVRGKLAGKSVDVCAAFDEGPGVNAEAPVGFALGFGLRSYSFRKYKSKASSAAEGDEGASAPDQDEPKLAIRSPWGTELAERFQKAAAVAGGVYLARDLINEPANVLTPPEFTERLRALEGQGLKVEVLDERALRSLGMNALLAVGQGSAQPSSAVVLRWVGAPRSQGENLVFIGKGVCFDTGGISIKPAQGMEEMKGDMAGAAAVAGALLSLAARRAPVNAVGLVGLVENMPSGTAIRPGDIITSASGKTIEILNTDAEGRLVLADLLWYAQAHLQPKLMITLATLTGAILVALGKENAGLFSNDDALASQIIEAGLDTGETAWRMPLSKKYNKMIDSKLADVKNIGGRDAGSITAAQFLQRFVEGNLRWAHLDIAGTAMGSPATDINHSWGSGYGVRLLDRFSERFFEG